MNLLIDIGHPGHVHLFKNLITELKRKGTASYASELAPLNRGLTTWKICLAKNTGKNGGKDAGS